VVFEYRPRAEQLGLALSSLGVALGLAYWELARRRRAAAGVREVDPRTARF
jgi:hypothetical protein